MTNPQRRGQVVDLSRPWPGVGPFLFTAHHDDAYPCGNGDLGPAVDVSDRPLGNDFGNPSGWSMYHGDRVPGFPAHPHRGFETITIVTKGVIDHADSTGASARYGTGDVQWVTAGSGVSHSEMFPLLRTDADNPFEIYQIWLNLPSRDKSAPAEFTMQWNEDIPVVTAGEPGAQARVRVIAGGFGGSTALAPPVHSWASDAASDVAIWLIELDPSATVTLPATGSASTERALYVHRDGANVEVEGESVSAGQGFVQTAPGELTLTNSATPAVVLVLQGVGIDEPVAQYGPFVMNTAEEIDQAFADYRRTQFGGWPWSSDAPVHPADATRFADYGNGRREERALTL